MELKDFIRQKYTFQANVKDQYQMQSYLHEYVEGKARNNNVSDQQQQFQQAPTIMQNNQQFRALKEHINKQEKQQKQRLKDNAQIKELLSSRISKLGKYYRQDNLEDIEIDQQLKYQEETFKQTNFLQQPAPQLTPFNQRIIKPENSQNQDLIRQIPPNVSPIMMQMDTLRDENSTLNTQGIEQLEEEMRAKNIIKFLDKHNINSGLEQIENLGLTLQNATLTLSSREASTKRSHRSNHIMMNTKKGVGGKNKKTKTRKLIKVRKPTTSDLINIQLNQENEQIPIEQQQQIIEPKSSTRIKKETEEDKQRRLQLEEEDKVQSEIDRVQNSLLQKIVQQTRQTYLIQKSHKASKPPINPRDKATPIKIEDDDVKVKDTYRSQQNISQQQDDNKSQKQNQEDGQFPPRVQFARKLQVDTNRKVVKEEFQGEVSFSPTKIRDSKDINIQEIKILAPTLKIDLLATYKQQLLTEQTLTERTSQKSSRRPNIIEGENQIEKLKQEIDTLTVEKSPLKQNYKGSKVLLYQNLKPANQVQRKIMYNDVPVYSPRMMKMYKKKKRQKKND